jgi:hypothetical protein
MMSLPLVLSLFFEPVKAQNGFNDFILAIRKQILTFGRD